MERCPHCHKPIDSGYSESILRLLAQYKLSKYGLAKNLGVNRQAVYAWIKGEYNPNPRKRMMIKREYPEAIIKQNYEWHLSTKPEEVNPDTEAD